MMYFSKKSFAFLLIGFIFSLTANAQDIHTAAAKGDFGEVKKLIAQNPELIHALNERKSTPLHIAASNGHLPVVAYLIDKGADVNARNQWDRTPLHYAASENYIQLAKLLLERGADVNGYETSSYTPLHSAAESAHKEMVDLLIAEGADVNRKGNMGTPLHRGAYSGNTEVMKSIIDAGADINTTSHARGWSPLHQAALSGWLDAARLLIEEGAELNTKGRFGNTPLQLGLLGGNREAEAVAVLLLESGADGNTKALTGDTPLLTAVQKGFSKAVKLMLEKGADVQVLEKETNRTLLHIAAIKGYGIIADLLIRHGIDVRTKDVYGKTALQYAAKHGNKSVAGLLTAAGAKAEEIEENYGNFRYLKEGMKSGEAYIWKLATRGWAVKTKNHLLVFDYEEHSRKPDQPLLANGFISADEIAEQNILAIYTAYHAQANEKAFIHGMEDSFENITYIHYKGDAIQGNTNEIYMSGKGNIRVQDVDIAYSEEHNKDGMGWLSYFIKVDGVTIFYAGFPSAKMDEYSESLDFLEKQFQDCDLAFLQMRPEGNDTTLVDQAISKFKPKAVFLNPIGQIRFTLQAEQEFMKKYTGLKLGFTKDYGERFHYKSSSS
ncbi:MAG: ankyrin repeat domain-containing protein [Candidatus Aminicenantes bacterium]|nr:ankyrin repeat domain-containing protein [Candidatus Aminicenantes bacterium]